MGLNQQAHLGFTRLPRRFWAAFSLLVGGPFSYTGSRTPVTAPDGTPLRHSEPYDGGKHTRERPSSPCGGNPVTPADMAGSLSFNGHPVSVRHALAVDGTPGRIVRLQEGRA